MEQLLKSKNARRYPRLDTVLRVEEFIKKHDGEYKRTQLWGLLPKKMMYQTFRVILDYLLQSNKISIDKEGKVGWIYYPELVQKYVDRDDLGR